MHCLLGTGQKKYIVVSFCVKPSCTCAAAQMQTTPLCQLLHYPMLLHFPAISRTNSIHLRNVAKSGRQNEGSRAKIWNRFFPCCEAGSKARGAANCAAAWKVRMNLTKFSRVTSAQPGERSAAGGFSYAKKESGSRTYVLINHD